MPAPLAYVIEVQGQAEASAEVDRFGNAIEESDKKAEKAAQTTKSMSMGILQAGAGFATAASGAVGLFFAYDNLQKGALRIETAEKNRDVAMKSVIDAQAKLDAMTQKGIVSGASYESAVLGLTNAKQQLAIAEQKVSIATGDLSQQQLNFALSVLPTVFGAIQGVQGALAILRGVKLANVAAEVASSAATAASIPILAVKTAATGAAATATGGLTLATRLLHLAMGPVGWIILGVSGFLALFATNAFGVRDAINAAGKAIGDAIPILRPLLDMLGSIANSLFPQTKDESDKMKEGVTTDLQQVGAEFREFESQSLASAGVVQTSIQDMSDVSSAAVDAMSRAVGASAGSIVTDAQRIESAMSRAQAAVGGFTFRSAADQATYNALAVAPATQAWFASQQGMTTPAGGATPFARVNIEVKLDSQTIARHMADARSGDLLKFT